MAKSIYEQLFDKLDLGIRVIDQERKPLIYNEKMRAIESMTFSDFTDRPFMDVFQFQNEKESRLIQALKYARVVENKRQTYFNAKGEVITTINHVYPLMDNDKVIAAVEIAKDVSQMEQILRDKRTNEEGTRFQFADLLGESPNFMEVVEQARRSSRTASPVLIIGETGTGKELFAQSIHNRGEREGKAFVTQNCAALPESLVEGILFGTAKGAFTGAIDRPGLFEQADGGTLLLDEVNALPLHLQPKLLRVLQEKKVTRIGEAKERPFDVRLLATLNEDPLEAIAAERLRKDLYYRLSVVSLFIPPLRERGDDATKLARFFLRKYNNRFHLKVQKFSDETLTVLQAYHWPGNVRELEHIIEGAMNFLSDETVFDIQHLPRHIREQPHRPHAEGSKPLQQKESLPERLAHIEQNLVAEAMDASRGNVTQAAQLLGISRQNLQYKLDKYNRK
ncbi:sigma-54 interaction domain-containing protein [Natribacillus halophilus]|uniref:Arginine utilization regulatory protein n=1 Tax=Natribacillus halophilus TaxID=549003 RepID=A0A1G8P0W0_9BACI|nr:sigma 54-interacting transcriptional regulator [Natribacillus halophilus]SDI85878.1 arginine utilization regulatory protein [Natribacillus halophilus]